MRMGARGTRRGGRQHQHTLTGKQDELVLYYDWAGCAVWRTWLRMGTRESAGEGDANTHKRAHRTCEYSTMTGLVALSGGPV